MSPELLFSIGSTLALAGWAVLAAGIALRRSWLRDVLAGLVVPLALSIGYAVLIAFAWPSSEGGFGSLADVRTLFASDWLLLAGWLHYLAFDLHVGASVARRMMDAGLPRLLLVPILPLVFLFGPVGFLLAQTILLVRKGKSK